MKESVSKTEDASKGAHQKRLFAGAVLVLLFSLLGYVGFLWAQNSSIAKLVKVSEGAERDTADRVEFWTKAGVGDEFDWGDGARTGEGESAHFRLTAGAQLTLKPASQIRFQRSNAENGLGIQVDVGEADVQTNVSELMLDSDFGAIVLSPNSTITMRRDGDQMVVAVELGQVRIGKERRLLEQGETVGLEIGGIVVDVFEPKNEPKPVEEPAEELAPLEVGDGLSYADLVADAGSEFTVHDPKPPTAVGIRTGKICEGPAELSIGKLKTQTREQGNLLLARGRHRYEVRCLDAPSKLAAGGAISILRDAGTKQLPAFTPSASVATDGRVYTVMYQYRLPRVTVTWPTAPQASSYTLTIDGRTIKTSSSSYTFQSLRAGNHRVVFAAESVPPRRSRTTTISVVYDSQAPAARVSEPASGYQPGEALKISGQALPGWKVSIDGKDLEVDSQRRFSSEHRAEGALPIAFFHPTHGTHYYLRRPQTSTP